MQTIVIEGKEFVLIPKEDLQPVNPQPVQNIQPEPKEAILNDFLPEDSTPTISRPKPLEIATIEERQEAIRVVDATTLQNVPKATAKESDYRKRFLEKELTANDVRIFKRPNHGLIKNFSEIPEIAELDSGNTPSKSTGPSFYGPGAQFDIA